MPMIYAIVLVTGFSLMTMEMAVVRVMSFHYGGSLYVWTAILGIIMAGLAVGYWLGAKISIDTKSKDRLFSLCGQAGLYTSGSMLLVDIVAQLLKNNLQNKLISSLLTSIILFAVPSIFMGMIGSFASKFAVTQETKKGETTGKIFALSTLGSIAGTFLSGIILIPMIGSRNAVILAGLLLGLFTLFSKQKLRWILPILIISTSACIYRYTPENMTIQMDRDSIFSRIMVCDTKIFNDQTNNTLTWRELFINNRSQSGFYTEYNYVVYPYIDYMLKVATLKENLNNALLLGGGGYTLPNKFIENNESSHLDVVEIDPLVTDTARKFFNLKDSPRLNILHEDARMFLKDNQKKYDLVFDDVFKDGEPPFYLLTTETFQKISDSMNNDGWLVSNLACTINGDHEKYFSSVYKTIKTVFPKVYIFPTIQNYNGTEPTNIILVATKNGGPIPLKTENPNDELYLLTPWTKEVSDTGLILTDDYSPTEYMDFFKKNQ